MAYDLYINSSTISTKEKFIRIFPKDETLTEDDLNKMKKYHRLYVNEEQRSAYLKTLVNSDEVSDEFKTEVIKDTAIHYLGQIFDDDKEFTTEVLLETVDGCRDAVESMVDVVQDYNIEDIQKLIANLSFHDFYTFDHSINVSMYCISIYKTLKPNADKEQLTLVGLGGLLHDLGKIKISTAIINNPGKLSNEEFNLIQEHPQIGKDLIDKNHCQCQGIDMDILSRVIYEHHENFNGTGYPNKLKGDDIHLFARITAIADFFDAITSKRSYSSVLTIDEAINVMSTSKGKKIDPKLFEIFTHTAQKFVKKGLATKTLPDDFDPCKPHDTLPLEEIKKEKKKKKEDFGKITFTASDISMKKVKRSA